MKDYWSKLKLNESWGKRERFNFIMNYIDEVIGNSESEEESEDEETGQKTGSVIVTVTDASTKKAVANADVSIYDKGEPFEGTTDNDGKCTISNVPYGDYTIEAVGEGYDFTVEQITINQATINYSIELQLE